MQLQANYYDFIKKMRPELIEAAELDAKELQSEENPPTTIHSVDDYQSRYVEYLKLVESKIHADFSAKTGLSVEQIIEMLPDMPHDVKNSIAALFNTVCQEYHSVVNFALSGKKTFYFHDNLVEHLANTEINLKSGLIELPFPTCLFIISAPSAIQAMYGNRHNVTVCYDDPVSVFITMHPANNADIPYRKLLICAMHGSHICIKRELCMDDNWTLEQSLRTDWQKLTPDNLGPGVCFNLAEGTTHRSNDEEFYTDGLLFFRIILNAVLYLSSDQAELSALKTPRPELEARAAAILSAPKRKKALQKARKYTTLDCIEVGASVKAISGDTGHGNKPSVRFMVRGHWRNQAFGTGRTDRKLIWIRPFYKGPDVAATINKPYIVK